MKKQKPYLELYKKCCKLGRLPDHGLCSCIYIEIGRGNGIEFKYLFNPLFNSNIKPISKFYWGADDYYNLLFDFGPTRQNMLLLMAAMNDEL